MRQGLRKADALIGAAKGAQALYVREVLRRFVERCARHVGMLATSERQLPAGSATRHEGSEPPAFRLGGEPNFLL